MATCCAAHAEEPAAKPAAPESRRWIVTIAGLGGDEPQSIRFREAIRGVHEAARLRWQVPEAQRRAIPHGDAPDSVTLGASREQITTSLAELAQLVQPDDAVWLFVFAHGNYDGRHAYLHLSGPDAPPAQWAAWLDTVRCREQVVFLTGAGSGWLLKPLSRAGRVVVTATAADDEFNATEFPSALVEATNLPLEKLDQDHDGRASLAELFVAIHSATTKRFADDQRIATEHAQLDDDGNGRGAEADAVERLLKANLTESATVDAPPPGTPPTRTPPPMEPASAAATDGAVAAKIFLPLAPAATPERAP